MIEKSQKGFNSNFIKARILLIEITLIDVKEWSTDETATWIEFIGYPQYKYTFIKYQISGVSLLELAEYDLRNYLFLKENDIANILNMIQSLT